MKFASTFAAALILTVLVPARDLHLAPTGDDSADGTADAPWRTPAHALTCLRGGDTLTFADGVYPLTEPLVLRVGSDSANWTTLRAAPGATPILDGSGFNWPGRNERGEMGLLQISDSTNVRLIGLTFRASPGGGLSAHAPSHHLDILGCRIDGSAHFGIGMWDVQHVRVLGCEVYRANFSQRRRDGSTGGGDRSSQEALSLGNVLHFEVAWNLVHHGGKEGIDIKRPSAHGRVHHNLVHHMSRQGLYLDSRRVGVMRDIEVDHNISYDNGWGLAFSGEQKTAEMEDIFAHHNLLYANRGSGLIIAPWVEDGPRRRLRIEHNTLVGNGSAEQHWSGSVGNLDLRTANLRDVVIAHNLCHDGGAFDLATVFAPEELADNLVEHAITLQRNRVAPAATWEPTVAGQFPRPHPTTGTDAIHAEPLFVNAAAGDFRLAPDAPDALRGLGAFAGEITDWAAEVRTHAGRWPTPGSQ
jgi:hypothetical protein